MKYNFVERLPRLITKDDMMKHKSSQGCDMDILVQNEYMTCGISKIPQGKRLGRIAAHGGDEIYHILSGECIVECPRHNMEVKLKKGETFHIPAGQIHAPRNDNSEEVVIFWVCAPRWP